MNKDIQTLIEREAEQLDSAIQHCIDIQEDNCTNELCKNDHHQLQMWLEDLRSLKSLFKWRKVSDELPEERTDINIKSHGCIYSSRMVRIDDVPIFFISGVSLTVKLEDITEWMPIPQID